MRWLNGPASEIFCDSSISFSRFGSAELADSRTNVQANPEGCREEFGAPCKIRSKL
jgi:hypothetical protein